MKKLILLGLFALIGASNLVYGQKNHGLYQLETEPTNIPARQGTYQFRIDSKDYSPEFPDDILIQIENARLGVKDFLMKWDEHVMIFIPSYDKIGVATFTPLEETIYITE